MSSSTAAALTLPSCSASWKARSASARSARNRLGCQPTGPLPRAWVVRHAGRVPEPDRRPNQQAAPITQAAQYQQHLQEGRWEVQFPARQDGVQNHGTNGATKPTGTLRSTPTLLPVAVDGRYDPCWGPRGCVLEATVTGLFPRGLGRSSAATLSAVLGNPVRGSQTPWGAGCPSAAAVGHLSQEDPARPLRRGHPNTPAALVVRVVGSVPVGRGPGDGAASVTRPARSQAGWVSSRPGQSAVGGPRAR